MILRRLLPRRMVLAMRVRGFEFVQARNALGQALPPCRRKQSAAISLSENTRACRLGRAFAAAV